VTQRRPSKQIDAPETPVVLVVDDDPSLREALGRLFRSVNLESKLFPSVAELLMHKFPDAPCCLVLDIRLPDPAGQLKHSCPHYHDDGPWRHSDVRQSYERRSRRFPDEAVP
jgi:CheY-like chemotaxis protein